LELPILARVTRPSFVLALFVGTVEISPFTALGAEQTIQSLLSQPILDSDQPLAEVRAYVEAKVPRLAAATSVEAWTRFAKQVRREVLQQAVFRGDAERWQKEKVKVVWLDTIAGGPGYHIRKLRYEALPGLWIPALLYEPDSLSGKVPVVLNVNGHEPIGKSVPYKQIRCINEARRGMLALNPEWLGMGQLNGPDYHHGKMNQLDLCGTSGLAPFYLALARGLDVLLAHPKADSRRVAVAGLSGGGWQTIMISALDLRVTLCNPVAGYSSFLTRTRHLEDLGDSEQTPCDLASEADYSHLTALLAPRPALLTYNARDNCCFVAQHALEPLVNAAAPIYELFGREQDLRWHINYDPGDHNFGQDNREAFYRMLRDHFYARDPAFIATEIPCDAEVKAHTNLLVELPADNATFNSLARMLAKDLPRQPRLPATKSGAEKWQRKNRARLAEIVRAKPFQAVATDTGTALIAETQATFWKFHLGDCWTLPGTELTRPAARGTILLIADGGRASASAEAERLLAKGRRVLAIDPFYVGESRIGSHDFLFALLIGTIGDRSLGLQASQVAALARWCHEKRPAEPVELLALGPRSSLIALVAAALEDKAVNAVRLSRSIGSLKEVIEANWTANEKPEMFCFGLLESFDMRHLAALVAPRPVILLDASQRVRSEMTKLRESSELLASSVEVNGP
jgi:hypothetical protein